MIDKRVASLDEAVRDVTNGATVLVGGFAFCGVPENLLRALSLQGARELRTVSDDCGFDRWGVGLLVERHRVRHMTLARSLASTAFYEQLQSGEVTADFVPLGTLAERVRCGAAGIPAFYTPTGVGTIVAEGKETREFEGRRFLLERAIVGDVALVAAWRGDRMGNLVYRKTARNTNPLMAAGARMCIAEVEELVEVGEIDPDNVHTPGIYVNRIVAAPRTKGAGHPLAPRAALARG